MTYCHCIDCKRVTGSPLPAFAAVSDVVFEPALGDGRTFDSGVTRWTCDACGSPLAARFPYLPDQIYIPLGLIDQAADHPPTLHCHAEAALPWLPEDNLPRSIGSGRDALRSAQSGDPE
ncbi:MAG: GFA family protein [Pseudomonadota bacterium]